MNIYLTYLIPVLFLMSDLSMAENLVTIREDGQYRYIESNGIPDHATGRFPNSGNPNSISEQKHKFRMPLNPGKTDKATPVQLSGVAVNGVPMEPGTDEFWHHDRTSGWRIQAFAPGVNLGLDQNNAHVQPGGMYHYHGVPAGIINKHSSTLVGWAADGFEIHYVGSKVKSSWRLKSGKRSSGPGGEYDGTYENDYEYVDGYGNLDQCNGSQLDNKYVYFITDEYPFIQRCVFGTPDSSFAKHGPGPGDEDPGRRPGGGDQPPPPGRDRLPPPPGRN